MCVVPLNVQANEELSDRARRRKVDQLLDAEQPPVQRTSYGASSYGGYGMPNYGVGSRYGGANFSSVYNDFFTSAYGAKPAAAASRAGTKPAGTAGGSTSYGAGKLAWCASTPTRCGALGVCNALAA